ncbi:putative RNA-directed DNA polymerase [Lupinus albus]|uniref:Putative RNA-directed DNA polymerase n=1 Tax=Lupinus albus TaxID=3870 RepID=A0A6A4NGU9_LUPAL|nr:putative RNA-directed DNA polymerase [Lupinus albus]
MNIVRDRVHGHLWLNQENYIKKVLTRFNMHESTPVLTPLAGHFKLSEKQRPNSQREIDYMRHVPYANAIGSIMYIMVCSRPDICLIQGNLIGKLLNG